MVHFGRWLGVAICAIALAACRGEERSQQPKAAPAAATTPQTPANGYTIRARIHPDLPEYGFTLIGDADTGANDVLRVRRIEIRRGTTADPIQTIADIDTRTPMHAGTPAVEVVDMNFDGYRDIRLVEFLPAGPNVPYLNWIFDPQSGRFLESPALNAIPSAEYVRESREIRSRWRDGPNRYGTDVYAYAAGHPVLVRKEVKEYKAPGVFTLQISRLVDGRWVVAEQREGRDP